MSAQCDRRNKNSTKERFFTFSSINGLALEVKKNAAERRRIFRGNSKT